MLRRRLILWTLASVAVGVLWLARADSAVAIRARLPRARASALVAMSAAPGCEVDPRLSTEQALALLLQDLSDPGCPIDQRIINLLATHGDPEVAYRMRRLLGRARGSERQRLIASLALIQRDQELPDVVRQELASGRLSPQNREAILGELVRMLGPEIVEIVLSEGGRPRYDAGASLAAARFADGDPATRVTVREALARELRRPTLAADGDGPGLSERRANLTRAVLSGLNLDSEDLARALTRVNAGYPTQGWPSELIEVLQHHRETCEDPLSDACALLLLDLLDLPIPPSEDSILAVQDATLPPPLPAPWRERVDELSAFPELVAAAAAWVRTLPSHRGGRVLGAVANRHHHYGWGPWQAGQRGDPADALRYGGTTPGATAVAAMAIGAAANVEIRAYLVDDRLVLESEGLRAWVGPCGPGVGEPKAERPAGARRLDGQTLTDLAFAEQASARLHIGQVNEAIRLASHMRFPEMWPQSAALRGSLLACQGVLLPSLTGDDAAYAAAWAVFCDEPDTATAIADQLGQPLPTLLERVPDYDARDVVDLAPGEHPGCGATWRVVPPGWR